MKPLCGPDAGTGRQPPVDCDATTGLPLLLADATPFAIACSTARDGELTPTVADATAHVSTTDTGAARSEELPGLPAGGGGARGEASWRLASRLAAAAAAPPWAALAAPPCAGDSAALPAPAAPAALAGLRCTCCSMDVAERPIRDPRRVPPP